MCTAVFSGSSPPSAVCVCIARLEPDHSELYVHLCVFMWPHLPKSSPAHGHAPSSSASNVCTGNRVFARSTLQMLFAMGSG